VASLIAFGAEYLDDALKTADHVREVVGLPTLGTVLRMKGVQDRAPMYRLATLLYPRSPASESYRTLRANVEFMSMDAPILTLLVTSSVPSEGKTVTAANLAVAFAQGGRRVLLIDADLRRPGVHEIFGLPNTFGLTSLLRREGASLDSITQDTEQDGLQVLGTGPIPPNPAELLGSQRMKSLIPTLNASYDLLVFDSPPLEAFTDSAVLSSFLDATILVVESRRGRRALVRRAREALAKANANVIGVVLNGLPDKGELDFARYYGAGTAVDSTNDADSIRAGVVKARLTPGELGDRSTARDADGVLPGIDSN
jgi:capsular exopolysaccharide synthesis family protein